MFQNININYYQDQRLSKFIYQTLNNICQKANYLKQNKQVDDQTRLVAKDILKDIASLNSALNHYNIVLVLTSNDIKIIQSIVKQLEDLINERFKMNSQTYLNTEKSSLSLLSLPSLRPIKAKNKSSSKANLVLISSVLIITLVALSAGFLYSNRLDQSTSQPTANLNNLVVIDKDIHGQEVRQLAENHLHLTDLGWQIFTSVEEIEIIEQIDTCGSYEIRDIQGCYEFRHGDQEDKILIARTTIEEQVVTFGHEFLHAIYNNHLTDHEKQTIHLELEKTYQLNKDLINDLLKNYDFTTYPKSRLDELHSVIGTFIPNISQELEDYYAQFFNRQIILEYTAHQIY